MKKAVWIVVAPRLRVARMLACAAALLASQTMFAIDGAVVGSAQSRPTPASLVDTNTLIRFEPPEHDPGVVRPRAWTTATVRVQPPALIPVPLPAARHGHRAEWTHNVVCAPAGSPSSDLLVVFGGFAANSTTEDRGMRETWLLRPGEAAWKRGTDLPEGRTFFASTVIDDTIYAIGSSLDRYDAAADRWDRVCPAETFPNTHFGAAAIGRRVYALGGFPARAGGFVGFDLDTRTVIDPPEPPDFKPGDHFHVVATIDGALHVVGGLDHETYQPTRGHWVFDGTSWCEATPPPRGLWTKFTAVQVVGSTLFLFDEAGGLRYDACTDSWTPIATFGERVAMPATVQRGGTIYLIGGSFPDDSPRGRNVLLRYEIATDRWSGP